MKGVEQGGRNKEEGRNRGVGKRKKVGIRGSEQMKVGISGLNTEARGGGEAAPSSVERVVFVYQPHSVTYASG